ncbi:hypothetical protein JTB14_002147 [Gonioctena quinquepunctata]|nr:hypothetical protein JTB14_002147 [Gonioctena quinquepunctata]
MNRSLKTKIPVSDNLLKPNRVSLDDAHTRILKKQAVAKHQYDKVCRERKELNVGQNITIKKNNQWEPGVVMKKASTPRFYIVEDADGTEYRRNSIHSRVSKGDNLVSEHTNICDNGSEKGEIIADGSLENDKNISTSNEEPSSHIHEENQQNYRSKRNITLPNRFRDFIMN